MWNTRNYLVEGVSLRILSRKTMANTRIEIPIRQAFPAYTHVREVAPSARYPISGPSADPKSCQVAYRLITVDLRSLGERSPANASEDAPTAAALMNPAGSHSRVRARFPGKARRSTMQMERGAAIRIIRSRPIRSPKRPRIGPPSAAIQFVAKSAPFSVAVPIIHPPTDAPSSPNTSLRKNPSVDTTIPPSAK